MEEVHTMKETMNTTMMEMATVEAEVDMVVETMASGCDRRDTIWFFWLTWVMYWRDDESLKTGRNKALSLKDFKAIKRDMKKRII
ncbi:unnamed protein product [Dovyalis caffra]|uniref:Uncharacterized protein n=1 Tax=Dovyalis caffra TaxID=77055 RepID=A0AAV1R306_9ROSI|nr:unnamed protein product [Dovyalis caffra]